MRISDSAGIRNAHGVVELAALHDQFEGICRLCRCFDSVAQRVFREPPPVYRDQSRAADDSGLSRRRTRDDIADRAVLSDHEAERIVQIERLVRMLAAL